MTEREKIIEIIKRNGTYNGRSLSFDYYVIQPDDLADALIAAGIGGVKETKHRAEVAERALTNTCAILYAQSVEYPYSDEEWQLQQAKKEFAEEKNNDGSRKTNP